MKKPVLGNNIAKIRKLKRITQQELANAIGMERTSLSQIETGRYCPSAETMRRISDVLNEPLGEIFFNPSVLNNKTEGQQPA
ncbi:helix-turn-helix transcriptional regulator [Brevibacillus thermoruber]|uniref:helix-turn-helix transcriptional regulator n=1 Tax=Brevibacillus thermoruber TaxID=33942 RepID=UPI0040427F9E